MAAAETIGAEQVIFRRMRRHVAACLALLLLSGCASTPKGSRAPSDSASRVVNYALSLQGAPYVYGKASPEEGFDCSGFVWHVYHRHGFPIPRTTDQMARALPKIEKDQRLPGDLVFFRTSGKPFSHVGIYLGHDDFIHAPSSRTGRVMVSGLDQPYWRKRFIGVRRPLQSERLVSENKTR